MFHTVHAKFRSSNVQIAVHPRTMRFSTRNKKNKPLSPFIILYKNEWYMFYLNKKTLLESYFKTEHLEAHSPWRGQLVDAIWQVYTLDKTTTGVSILPARQRMQPDERENTTTCNSLFKLGKKIITLKRDCFALWLWFVKNTSLEIMMEHFCNLTATLQ